MLPGESDGTAFNGTYSYLGKGGQSYVFVSEDGRSVLKLMRSSKLKLKQSKIEAQEKLLRETLLSYDIANRYFKEETGIIHTHLSPGGSGQIRIKDKLGICHTLDARHYPYIIQEKAMLVKEKIAQSMDEGDVEKARLTIRSLFALLKARSEKGIEDGDPNLIKNFGFCGDRPIQIDPGRFSSPATSLKKLTDSKQDLQNWIDQYYPQLSHDLDQAYQEIYEAL